MGATAYLFKDWVKDLAAADVDIKTGAGASIVDPDYPVENMMNECAADVCRTTGANALNYVNINIDLGNAYLRPRAFALINHNIIGGHLDIRSYTAADFNTGAVVVENDKPVLSASELVTNGEFTSDITGWTAGNSAQLSSFATGYHGKCLRITENGASYPNAYQDITVEPGKKYWVTARVKPWTENQARLVVYDLTNGENVYWESILTPPAGWNILDTTEFEAPAGCTTVRIFLESASQNGEGFYIDFDNVSLTESVGEHDFYHRESVSPVGEQYWQFTLTNVYFKDDYAEFGRVMIFSDVVELSDAEDWDRDRAYGFRNIINETAFGVAWAHKLEERREAFSLKWSFDDPANMPGEIKTLYDNVYGRAHPFLFIPDVANRDCHYVRCSADRLTWKEYVDGTTKHVVAAITLPMLEEPRGRP